MNSNWYSLLIQPGVAEELNLTDDQFLQIKVALVQYRESELSGEPGPGWPRSQFQLEQLTSLLPFQLQRIKEIQNQHTALVIQDSYFGLKSCIDFLKITPHQMKIIDQTVGAIDKQFDEECNEIRAGLEEKLVMYQARQISNLTPEQKKAYESFFGKMFLGSNLIYKTPLPKLLKK